MVKMPVRIDQGFDWILAHCLQRFADLFPRVAHPCIYNEFSVRASKYGDVSAGSCQHAYVSSQLLDCDISRRRSPPCRCYESGVLREQLARSQECDARCCTSRCEKPPARNSPIE